MKSTLSLSSTFITRGSISREIDTVLFLRPTESLTVFLQQLGRGLRLFDGKPQLTVIDFIAQHNTRFSFEERFKALVDRSHHRIDEEVEQGFPHLPSGCVISLERVAKQRIIENIKDAINQNRRKIVAQLRTFEKDTGKALSMGTFLRHYRLGVDDIYRKAVSWSRLCAEAGVRPDFSLTDEETLTRGLRRIAHIDDIERIDRMIELLSTESLSPLDEYSQSVATMAHFSLWGKNSEDDNIAHSLARVRNNTQLCSELIELLKLRREEVDYQTEDPRLPYYCSLRVGASYTWDEVLAALGVWTLQEQPEMREGVRYIRELNTDIFLVTLNKTESDYSPTTMYKDYAINSELFHCESQSTTSDSSETGKRYVDHVRRGTSVLLFVREFNKQNGLTEPYHFLGPVTYVRHTGSKPMAIVWKLAKPMPARFLWTSARLVVS